jgi:endonuclease-3
MIKQSKRQQHATDVYKKLKKAYPDAHCALHHRNAFELAVATILSAQCTDVRVNQVTPALFKKYPNAEKLAAADQADVEELIRSTGFFRNKAKSLIGLAQGLVEDFDGQIPAEMDQLIKLPGIGRKTANVILGNAFGKSEGVVVDTHIKRLSQRLGFTKQETPEKIEADLMKLIPQKEWTQFAHVIIFHGRQVCNARKPKCDECVVAKQCPSAQVMT